MNYLLGPDDDTQETPPAPAPQPTATEEPPAPVTTDDDPFADTDDMLADPNAGGDEPAIVDNFAEQNIGQQKAQEAPAPPPMAQAAPQAPADMTIREPQLQDLHPGVQTVGHAPDSLSSLVLDVEVAVEVYFGDAHLTVEEFLELGKGSVVALDHEVTAPIELRVKDNLVARGQLVTINGCFGLRITDMVQEGK